jgi:hypothetical protein
MDSGPAILSESPSLRLTDYTLRLKIRSRNDSRRLRSRFQRGQDLLDAHPGLAHPSIPATRLAYSRALEGDGKPAVALNGH